MPLSHARRNDLLHPIEVRLKVIGQLARRQVRFDRDHAAADIHSHGGRNDSAVSGDHRADGRTDPDVCIGHERHMAGENRKPACLPGLGQRSVVDIGRPIPKPIVDLCRHGGFLVRVEKTERGAYGARTHDLPLDRRVL